MEFFKLKVLTIPEMQMQIKDSPRNNAEYKSDSLIDLQLIPAKIPIDIATRTPKTLFIIFFGCPSLVSSCLNSVVLILSPSNLSASCFSILSKPISLIPHCFILYLKHDRRGEFSLHARFVL